MQKLYLLLRNNYQTGPYTIDELLQQQLRPSDLVWVDGCSQAWLYPSELAELKEIFGSDNDMSPVNQLSARPNFDEIEQRAEELRKAVLSAPKRYVPRDLDEESIVVEALRSLAQQRIEFIDHRKKESPLFERMSAAMVTFIVIASVYGGTKFFIAKTALAPSVVTKAMSIDSHAAKIIANTIPSSAFADQQGQTDTIALTEISKPKPVTAPKRKRRINVEALPATAIQRVSPPKPREETPSISIQAAADDTTKEAIEPEPRPIVAEEPVEKKKTFGLFKGLFKKKKKGEEKPAEQEARTMQEQSN